MIHRWRARPWWLRCTAALVAGAALLAALAVGTSRRWPPTTPGTGPNASAPRPGATRPSRLVAVPPVGDRQLAALPEISTSTVLPAAPIDADRFAAPSGAVVHNDAPVAVFAAPGGPPIGRLPATQLGSDTWLPVIEEQPDWVRLLLPTRPNGATGWVDTTRVQIAHTPDQVRVEVATRTLRLLREGRVSGAWPVAVGAEGTPTPTGRTFLLASIRDTTQPGTHLVLPLGAHSETLDTFGGGPGTVAIHSWPDPTALGTAVSHGCIRAPDAAMAALMHLPLGTPVLIVER
ncbi:MAG: L,D-transpeptidase [Micromonosporaceae bacterium]|nr:L,D-transpeptidase [Micromonosporaceae bacterium]